MERFQSYLTDIDDPELTRSCQMQLDKQAVVFPSWLCFKGKKHVTILSFIFFSLKPTN
jgi:hypothetical protein